MFIVNRKADFLLCSAELTEIKLCIEAVLLDKRRMISAFNNMTVFHYQYYIGFFYCGKAVCHYNDVRPAIILENADCIFISVRVSIDEVASSRISICGSDSIARAMHKSWR